jgi:IclR family transcriptional regulator, KDG regulon repressor
MATVDTKMIKSAQRVLEVLEYFDRENTKATVMDIARRLGYPQSSTSELLKCLVTLGYLNYDRYKRRYELTARVTLLGAWVQPALFRRGHLLPMLDEINRMTGLAVSLSAVVGLEVRHLHVVAGEDEGEARIAQGQTRSLLRSAVGRVFMGSFSDMRVRELVHRLNANEPDPERWVRLPELNAELKRIRQTGYAIEAGEYEDGLGAVHMLLPHRDGQLLALGVTASAEEIRQDGEHYASILRMAMRRELSAPRTVVEALPAPPVRSSYPTAKVA